MLIASAALIACSFSLNSELTGVEIRTVQPRAQLIAGPHGGPYARQRAGQHSRYHGRPHGFRGGYHGWQRGWHHRYSPYYYPYYQQPYPYYDYYRSYPYDYPYYQFYYYPIPVNPGGPINLGGNIIPKNINEGGVSPYPAYTDINAVPAIQANAPQVPIQTNVPQMPIQASVPQPSIQATPAETKVNKPEPIPEERNYERPKFDRPSASRCKRLNVQLDQEMAQQSLYEGVIQNEIHTRAQLEAQLARILNKRPPGRDTPSEEEAQVYQKLAEMNTAIKADRKALGEIITKIERLQDLIEECSI